MRQELMDFLAIDSLAMGGPAIDALPRFKGDHIRPHKGGGGGNAAWEIERERQRKAQQAIAAINDVFDNANREALYRQQRDDVYALNTKEVERQARQQERANRFALARNGLLGGSADIEGKAELNRLTNEGLAKAGGIADAAMSDLRNADENARNNLVSMANAGTDATTASQLASNNLRQNASAAAADRAIASVGDLFGSMQQAYLLNNMGKIYSQTSGLNPYVDKAKLGNDPHATYTGS